jgi:hypothetical protein
LNPRDYRLYKELRNLHASALSRPSKMVIDNTRAMFEKLSDDFSIEKDILLQAVDACSNYSTNVYFEISPRNVAVKDGKLILLDVFFLKD